MDPHYLSAPPAPAPPPEIPSSDTATHRTLRSIFTKKWLLLIFGLMVIIGLLYIIYLITTITRPIPLQSIPDNVPPTPLALPVNNTTPTSPSCQNISSSPELTFLQNYCTGYYCTDFQTQAECEAVDVVTVENNALSESSGTDGLPDCLWDESANPGYQCQIAYP